MKYITTPIYYVNDLPHLGHAYTTFAADILTHYWRQRGEEVFFLTGTDEHGQKNANSANEKGLTPQEFVDHQSKFYQKAWKELNIKNNFFIRTTDQAHVEYVKDFLTRLYRKDEIYKGVYEGLYCEGCEAYLKEEDLKNGYCPDHKTPPEKIEEEVYFFKLSHYQRRLEEVIEEGELQVMPETRKNEVLSFLKKEKLEDLAITRSKVDWGIEVPWDKNQTIYVWVDALFNYLSALKINGKESLWPADTQLMAKDILRFHAVIWPAILMAAEMPLPKKLFIHGFFKVEGEKMSKSIGNVLDPVELSHKYGEEVVRYYLFRAFPFGQDGSFKVEDLKSTYRSDLANEIGNLVQRTLTMINKYQVDIKKESYQVDKDETFEKAMQNLDFYRALERINQIARDLNRFIEREKPWKLYDSARKATEFDLETDKKDKFQKIFDYLVKQLNLIAFCLYPFMPVKSQQMSQQLKDLEPEPLFPKDLN